MSEILRLEVYRRLDNRQEGLPDNSPRALELHNLRKQALHEIFDEQSAIDVRDWGDTDDTESHELVFLLLGIAGKTVMDKVILPGIQAIGKKLLEKAIDKGTSSAIEWIVGKLRRKQEEKKLLDFTITLPNKTMIRVDSPATSEKVQILFADGTAVSIDLINTKLN